MMVCSTMLPGLLRNKGRLIVSSCSGRSVIAKSCPRRRALLGFSTTTTTTRFSNAASSSCSARHDRSSSSSTSSSSAAPTSSVSRSTTAAIALLSLGAGYIAGTSSSANKYPGTPDDKCILPDGLPRTCCEENQEDTAVELTQAQKELPNVLKKIIGHENVLDGTQYTPQNLPFLKGARLGKGNALCIITPKQLVDVQDCVQAIVDAGCIVLPQGQNTGLTGGSVPHSSDTDSRPAVVLSMKYLDRIFPIDDGQRVVCLAGVGLASLSQFLAKYFPDRESHSQLGSTFLNPTTAAGISLGSGGTQLRKGPAYTERALYLKISQNKWNENIVEVVNTLGIDGMQDKHLPEGRARKHMDSVAYRLDTWSRWIEQGFARDMRYSSSDANGRAAASYPNYPNHVSLLDNNVSRYNADTHGPDFNRSEGKVVILATVHDTFEKPKRTKTYWIGFDSLDTALAFRREVCLDNPQDLPISLEYLNRDAYDVIDQAGRGMVLAIYLMGPTSSLLRYLWNVKLWIEALPLPGAPLFVDKLLHKINPLIPGLLPRNIAATAQSMDHHVAMTIGDFGDGSNIKCLLDRLQRFATRHGHDKIVIHDCSNRDEAAIKSFRFVAASAFRTWCVGEGLQGISVDYALPKNDGQQPAIQDGEAKPLKRMRYSHFGCNVVHEDLAYAPGVDVLKAKYNFKTAVEFKCGGKLPAEHGHGTEYTAPKETQERWKKMDPLNVFNPGVGGLSNKLKYSS